MVIKCAADCGQTASLKRPKTGDALCKQCFFSAFEAEIHNTITAGNLFKPGMKVAIGASGGKDSTVLAYVLKLLNERHNYGLNLTLLSIDEGITGYRDDSLDTVKQNQYDYQMPLKILSYKDLYGWTMDEIVAQIGRKNNCTFCGVFRRQALDRGAAQLEVDCIATGHNADDIAETVLMNVLRGDIARLQRCTAAVTAGEGAIPRVKPLKYAYEKEIVMYAHFHKLVYFSTECVFAPNAYRGHARVLLKDMERVRPSVIMDIIHSGETLQVRETTKLPQVGKCKSCGFVSSQEVCKACFLLEGLNRGLPKLGIGKSSKSKKLLAEQQAMDKLTQQEKNKLKEDPIKNVDSITKEEESKLRDDAVKNLDKLTIQEKINLKENIIKIEENLNGSTKTCGDCVCNSKKKVVVPETDISEQLIKDSDAWIPDLNGVSEHGEELELDTNRKADHALRKNKNDKKKLDKKRLNVTKPSIESVLEDVDDDFDIPRPLKPWPKICENCTEPCKCLSAERKKLVLENFFHQFGSK